MHELAHFLGAAHSNSKSSVMRPRLADGQARANGFQIQLDATNVLLMSIIGRELRSRKPSELKELTSQSKMRLRQIYASMAVEFPSDPVPTKYLELLFR